MSAKRDENRVPTLQGVSNIDFLAPTDIAVNPQNHAMEVETSLVVIPNTQVIGSIIGNAQSVIITVPPGAASVGLQITGTWVGTIAFQGTTDGSTWTTLYSINGITSVSSATANGLFIFGSAGLATIRVNSTAWTSGTANITMNATIGAPAVSSPTISLAANSSVNVAQIAGTTTLTGNGTTGAGSQRVTIASDNTAFSVNATLSAETTKVIGTINIAAAQTLATVTNLSQMGGVAISLNTGVRDTGTQRVTIATNDIVPASQSGTWTVQPGNTANTTAWKVDGSAVTQPVSGTVSITTNSAVNVAQINAVTPLMGNGVTGTGSQRVTIASDNTAFAVNATLSAETTKVIGTVNQGTSPWIIAGGGTAGTAASGVVTIQGIASMTKLLVTPDSVALPANQSVNMAQVAGTNSVTAGVAGTLAVGGNVATNVAIGTNPINLGAQAVSSENTAVTATRMAQLVTDLVGKLIVLPYANPENFVSGVISTAMTGTTSTSLIAAPAAGLRNYITQITVSNSHATVGTDMIIQDGSGGTTLYVIPAAAAFGGATLSFPTPLRQPTTATAIFIANVTTGANTKASASGYKGS